MSIATDPVYIVTHGWDYEGEEIVGVWLSYEDAMDAVLKNHELRSGCDEITLYAWVPGASEPLDYPKLWRRLDGTSI